MHTVVKYICTNIITILVNYSNFCLSVVTHHHWIRALSSCHTKCVLEWGLITLLRPAKLMISKEGLGIKDRGHCLKWHKRHRQYFLTIIPCLKAIFSFFHSYPMAMQYNFCEFLNKKKFCEGQIKVVFYFPLGGLHFSDISHKTFSCLVLL